MTSRLIAGVLFLCSTLLTAQEIRLSTGATDHQVFQRGESGSADIRLGGTVSGLAPGKSIEARLTAVGGKAVKGFQWSAKLAGSTWSGELKGVPAGGPYNLELRAPGAPLVQVKDLLVGDLWVLAGQSNMEGVADLKDVQPPDARVHSFTMYDEWTMAKEPLHELPAALDSVHWSPKQTAPLTGPALEKWREARKKGAGSGLPFAVEMVKRTGIPIGIVPCAHGGTSMAQWDPALKEKGGASLYGGMVRRVLAVGGKVKGVLWYQGESDTSAKSEALFHDRFVGLIAAIRHDFGQADLPFYYVQLGRYLDPNNQLYWNRVQDTQRTVEAELKNVGVVAAVDLALDDLIHIGTQGQKTLGMRMANLATGKTKRGPHVLNAQWSPGTGLASSIRVTFAEVNGALQAPGRPAGFSIHNAEGAAVPMIYRVDPDGSSVVLHITGKLPAGGTLAYGAGKDPYCNITDAAGMGMLVFWAIPINTDGKM